MLSHFKVFLLFHLFSCCFSQAEKPPGPFQPPNSKSLSWRRLQWGDSGNPQRVPGLSGQNLVFACCFSKLFCGMCVPKKPTVAHGCLAAISIHGTHASRASPSLHAPLSSTLPPFPHFSSAQPDEEQENKGQPQTSH